jgi:hypothetical protein
MAINFPNSPVLNQTVSVGARLWKWNGLGWQLATNKPAGSGGATSAQAPTFDTRAEAEAFAPSSAPNTIRTLGYWAAGDLGGALYKKVAAEPDHPGKFSITLDDEETEIWYEIAERAVNIKMFGAKMDWDSNDGAATDDRDAIQDALDYVGRRVALAMAVGEDWGGTCWVPKGGAKVGSMITVPAYTTLKGEARFASRLHKPAGFADTHFINLGDPTTELAAFDASIEDMILSSTFGEDASSLQAMVYSNNIQENSGLRRVSIRASHEVCVRFETGYGGAASCHIKDCELLNLGGQGGLTNNPIVYLNYGTTIVHMSNNTICGPGSGPFPVAVVLLGGGVYRLDCIHIENAAVGVQLDMSDGHARLSDVTGNSGVTTLVQFVNTHMASARVMLMTLNKNGATNLIVDGRPGGATNTNVVLMGPTVM